MRHLDVKLKSYQSSSPQQTETWLSQAVSLGTYERKKEIEKMEMEIVMSLTVFIFWQAPLEVLVDWVKYVNAGFSKSIGDCIKIFTD